MRVALGCNTPRISLSLKLCMSRRQATDRMLKASRWIVILAILGIGVAGVAALKSLYADGSWYLLTVITSGKYNLYPSRELAGLITQTPLLLGLWIGVRDIDALARLYGVGLIGVPILLWIYALSRTVHTSTFWLFVLAFCWIYLIGGFFAIGEYNVAYAVVAAASAILVSVRIGKTDSLVLLLIAILSTRSYELMGFAGPILGLATLGRLYREKPMMGKRIQLMTLLAAALFLLGGGMGIWAILHPTNPVQLDGALSGLSLLVEPAILYAFTLSVMAILASLKSVPSWLRPMLVGSGLTLAAGYFLHNSWHVPPSYSYAYRAVLVVPMMAGLSLLLIYTVMPRMKLWSGFVQTRSAVVLICVLLVTQGAIFLADTYGFAKMVKAYRIELHRMKKSTSVNQTFLGKVEEYHRYLWGWTNPAMSQLLGNGKHVIYNEKGNFFGFEPYLDNVIEKDLMRRFRKR